MAQRVRAIILSNTRSYFPLFEFKNPMYGEMFHSLSILHFVPFAIFKIKEVSEIYLIYMIPETFQFCRFFSVIPSPTKFLTEFD